MLFLVTLMHCRKKLFTLDQPLCNSLAIISCSLLLSLFFSDYKMRSCIFIGWWSITIMFYIILPYLLFSVLSMKKILFLYFLSFFVVGCYAFLQFFLSCIGIIDPFVDQFVTLGGIVRANACCYEPSYYALYMTPFVMMANIHFVLKEKSAFFIFHPLKKRHLFTINALFLISTSTTTFFAYLFLCISFIFFLKREHLLRLVKFFSTYAIACLAMMLALPFLAVHFFLKFFYQGFLHHSFYERWMGIVNGFTLFRLSPIVGVGIGAYPFALMERYGCRDTRFSFNESGLGDTLFKMIKCFEPSNALLEIAASLGVIGIAAFAFFFYCFYQQFRKIKSHKLDTTQQNWALSFFLSSIVMLAILQCNQGLFRTYIWTHLALSWGYFNYCYNKMQLSRQDLLEENEA